MISKALKLNEIISMISPGYRKKIEHLNTGRKIQKSLDRSTDQYNTESLISELLNQDSFNRRLKMLGVNARNFYSTLLVSGLAEDIKLDKNSYLASHVTECLDNLVMFAVPSKENPEFIVIPVEYAIYSSRLIDDGNMGLLNFLTRTYTLMNIQKMADELGIRAKGSRDELAAKIYCHVINNMNSMIENLNDDQKSLMEFILKSYGIATTSMVFTKFGIKAGGSGYYSSYLNTRYFFENSFLTNGKELLSMIRKGLVAINPRKGYDSVTSLIIPNEVYFQLTEKNKQALATKKSSKRSGQIRTETLGVHRVNLHWLIKRVMAVIQYLEITNKRRSTDTIEKYTSLNSLDVSIALYFSFGMDLLEGEGKKLKPSEECSSLIDEDNFYQKIVNNILSSYFNAFNRMPGNPIEGIINFVKSFSVELLSDIDEPILIKDLCLMIEQNDRFVLILRTLLDLMIYGRSNYIYGLKTTGELRKFVDKVIMDNVIQMAYLLSAIGVLQTDGSGINEDATIFPEKVLDDLMTDTENFKKLDIKEERSGYLKVLPDHEVLVGIGSRFKDICKVMNFAELLSANEVLTFRISTKSITSFLNAGGDSEEIYSFLKRHSSTGIPENVKRTISDVSEKRGDTNLIKCKAVFLASNASIIDEILGIPELNSMVERRIGGTAVALKEDAVLSKFVVDLRKKGYIIPFAVQDERKKERAASRGYYKPWRY